MRRKAAVRPLSPSCPEGSESLVPELVRTCARPTTGAAHAPCTPSGSFTETGPLSRPRRYRPSTNATAHIGSRMISTRPTPPNPSLRSKEDNPPAILTFGIPGMTSLSVDEMPCRIEVGCCLLGRCAVNNRTVLRRGRAPPQASRSQLPVIPDFSPKSAENSGPLPRRRIDFM